MNKNRVLKTYSIALLVSLFVNANMVFVASGYIDRFLLEKPIEEEREVVINLRYTEPKLEASKPKPPKPKIGSELDEIGAGTSFRQGEYVDGESRIIGGLDGENDVNGPGAQLPKIDGKALEQEKVARQKAEAAKAAELEKERERNRRAELARQAAEAKKREEAKQLEARKLEQVRQEEEARKVIAAKKAEEVKRAAQAKLAEDRRLAREKEIEEERLEATRLAELAQRKQENAEQGMQEIGKNDLAYWTSKMGAMNELSTSQLKEEVTVLRGNSSRFREREAKGKQAVARLGGNSKQSYDSFFEKGFKAIQRNYIAPRYNPNVHPLKFKGEGKIRFLIDEQGRISSINLVNSTGIEELDNAFIQALRKTKRLELPSNPLARKAFILRPKKLVYNMSDMEVSLKN